MDLTTDYSEEALTAAKAGSDAIIAKLDELGVVGQDKVSEFMMATMKIFSRAAAAAYVAAQNREQVEIFMDLHLVALEQRISAEVVDIEVARATKLEGS